jgi:hypothetical protein
MPLPLPNLDDRRWADLVEEGRALIPRYARAWTDHNISDPGITLMELFAVKAEASTFALNRITERHRRQFLSLIGFAPRPPQPAHAMAALTPANGAATLVLPAGVEMVVPSPGRAAVTFRTLRRTTVSDTRIDAVQIDEGLGLENRTAEWRSGLPLLVFGGDPQPGAAIYLGFKTAPTATPIALAFRWGRPGADAVARAQHSQDERERLVAEHVAQRFACRPLLPDITCPDAPPIPDPPPVMPPHHSARVVWEVFTGTWTALTAVDAPAVPAAGQVADDTRSLTLDGLVEMNLPATAVVKAHGAVAAPMIYVRCRLARGQYDEPPTLIDVAVNAVPCEQSVVLSHRFTIPAGVAPAGPAPAAGAATRVRIKMTAPGVISALTFDPAAAGIPDVLVLAYQPPAGGSDGQLTLALVPVGFGNKLPNQSFAIGARAVVSDEALAIYSHDGSTWRRWQTRPNFASSHRTDWHVTLDRTRGVVTFGDGERGRVLPDKHAVFVAGRVTAAGAAATSAGAPVAIARSAMNAQRLNGFPITPAALAAMTTMVWPAAGGADQETVKHASGRAAQVLHAHERLVDLAEQARTDTLDRIDPARVLDLATPTRAISALDLERMARDVPGTRVARARAWSGIDPQSACLVAPGSIALVVIPAMPVAQPQPSPGLLRALRRYLERRRMVTSMLHIVGPTYVVVNVGATVRTKRGAGALDVRERIERALRSFLDPLRGGPDGLGWPFGRPVYRSEILQVIDGVAGVDHVTDLTLTADGGVPQCGNLTVCPTSLAASGIHQIRIE